MSPQPGPGKPLEGLQFEKAEFADSRRKCSYCAQVIQSEYYHLAGQTICPNCADLARAGQQRPKTEWVLRGVLYGAGAAAACSAGYAIITWVTGMELALISILVGYLIGRAVRTGSHGLGGRRCQIIAVVFTYLAITVAYVPLIIREAAKKVEKNKTEQSATAGQSETRKPAPESKQPISPGRAVAALGVITGIALISPFLGLLSGGSGILGILIIFFGLSRAWAQTARDERLLMGPYREEAPNLPAGGTASA